MTWALAPTYCVPDAGAGRGHCLALTGNHVGEACPEGGCYVGERQGQVPTGDGGGGGRDSDVEDEYYGGTGH